MAGWHKLTRLSTSGLVIPKTSIQRPASSCGPTTALKLACDSLRPKKPLERKCFFVSASVAGLVMMYHRSGFTLVMCGRDSTREGVVMRTA